MQSDCRKSVAEVEAGHEGMLQVGTEVLEAGEGGKENGNSSGSEEGVRLT